MTNIEKWLTENGFKPAFQKTTAKCYVNVKDDVGVILNFTGKTFTVLSPDGLAEMVYRRVLSSVDKPFEMCGTRSEIIAISVNHDKKLVAVKFSDGDVRIIHCSPEDQFDPEIGFCIAVTRHLFGSRTKVRSFLDTRATVIAKTEQKPKLDDGSKEK